MEISIEHYPKKYLEMIYKAARNCYGVRDALDTKKQMTKLVKFLIKKGHGSVLEHICVSIYVKDVSRSFLAQLTRHRLVSYSVKSQHFVNHKNFKYKDLEIYGDAWEDNEEKYERLMKQINKIFINFVKNGIPHYIAREILPNACLTDIYITTNIREWRLIIGLRMTNNNTPEIRDWARTLLLELYNLMPELFEDLYNQITEEIKNDKL